MTTKLIIDKRRTDDRRVINSPYWITSAEMDPLDDGVAIDETESYLLFSFPAAKYGTSMILVLSCVFQVVELFAGGTITIDVGTHTILTDDVTDGDVMTIVDVDDYIATGDITYGTTGAYWTASADFGTLNGTGFPAIPTILTPADATVPAVGVHFTNDGTAYTTGKGRFHMLISEVPLI